MSERLALRSRDKPSLDELFAELDADEPLDKVALFDLFDRMKLHYPERMEEVRQRMQAREDKARDQVTQAKREYEQLWR
jgi:hypothetical protein